MRRRTRAIDVYLFAAMLAAAAVGRLLDHTGLLPGVQEAAAVRGAGLGWCTALLAAALVGAAAASRWHRTRGIVATSWVVLPGQLAVFLCAEAAVRLARGQSPFDPDGLVGALLQAGVALLLLLALSSAAWLLVHCTRSYATAAPIAAADVLATRSDRPAGRCVLLPRTRGPPVTASTLI
jgi:hypothetical protein